MRAFNKIVVILGAIFLIKEYYSFNSYVYCMDNPRECRRL